MNYLAYGSNLHPLRLARRLGPCRWLGVEVLRGFRLAFAKPGEDGSGKCTLIETGAAGDRLYAALYAIDDRARRRLDEFEGLGRGYVHRWIELDDGTRALTYQATAPDETLRPFGWYRALVLHGARFHRFPRWYRRAIVRVPAMRDDVADRRREHIELLLAMRRLAAQPEPARPQRDESLDH